MRPEHRELDVMDLAHDQGAARARPLRILMVTARFLPDTGGIETHVYQVATRLVRLGHHVTVLTTDRAAGARSVEAMDGVQVVRVAAWPRRKDFYFAPEIYAEVCNGEWDLVHVQGCHTFVPIIAMAACIRARRKFVVTFHSGGHSSWLRKRIRRIQWAVLSPLFRRADHLIGVSRFEAGSFSRSLRIPPQRFSVILNGAQMPEISNKPARDQKLIVSVGRLEKYKGHHRLIQAIPHLLARDPELSFRIVGDGPYKEPLLRLAQKLQVDHRVEIAGVPPERRQDMARILSSAALVVLLSEYEAHPIAVMEALACGARVLVTNGSGLADLVEDGLVSAVEMDATDEVVAERVWTQMRREREERPIQLPSWEACVCSLEAIYRAVTNTVHVQKRRASPDGPEPRLVTIEKADS